MRDCQITHINLFTYLSSFRNASETGLRKKISGQVGLITDTLPKCRLAKYEYEISIQNARCC